MQVAFETEILELSAAFPRLRVKSDSQRRCPIRLRRRSKQRIIPLFVLKKRSDIYIVADPPVCVDGSVVDIPATRDKIGS